MGTTAKLLLLEKFFFEDAKQSLILMFLVQSKVLIELQYSKNQIILSLKGMRKRWDGFKEFKLSLLWVEAPAGQCGSQLTVFLSTLVGRTSFTNATETMTCPLRCTKTASLTHTEVSSPLDIKHRFSGTLPVRPWAKKT